MAVHKCFILLIILLTGCIGIPDRVTPVSGFEVQRYLGLWYEIARLDHSFERGLERVTAQYSVNDDGTIRVVNRGFDPRTNQWKEAVGRASFVSDAGTGRLKVSFFGPFYGSYNIISLDKEHYSHALVCGSSWNYLWILSREPRMDDTVKRGLISKAEMLGFETQKLIYVRQVP